LVTRRRLLATAGTAAAALPFLGGARAARAASGAPIRLVIWPSLNGAEPGYFWPNPGNLAAMSQITAPLAPYQKQITFVKGVDIDGSYNHFAVRSMFTGFPIADYLSPDPTVQSVDQVVADYFQSKAPAMVKSMHLGAIPADALAYYQLYGRSTFFFSPKAVDYEANPVTAFDRFFKGGATPGTPTPAPTPGVTPPASYENDVLNLVDAELNELGTRLKDSAELGKIQQHRLSLQTIRPAAAMPTTPGMTTPTPPVSMPPAMMDASALASVEKLRPMLQGNAKAAYTKAYYSDIFDAQVDIMSRALVSGMTRVATLQAGSADGNPTDQPDPSGRPAGYEHHNTSHGTQDIFARCQNWYAQKFLRLLKALDVKDPLDPSGKTVLYNSVIVWLSECQPVSHDSHSVPAFIAGNAGGALKAGSFLDLKSVSSKALLQTVVQLCGAPNASHFGGASISELKA
jgi:hypothetical protein